MADAAVEFLLSNLKGLVQYQVNLKSSTRKDIEILENDLGILNGFLKNSLKSRRNNGLMKALDLDIRNLVYDVEDVIDTFVTQAQAPTKIFGKRHIDLNTTAQKVKDVKVMVERARTELLNLNPTAEDRAGKPEAPQPRQKNVVGFEDVTKELKDRLTIVTDYLDVVCLIGMFGLGKTTLAWKIFNDETILYEFPIRIWLSISKEFSDKDIFLTILKEFIPITNDIRENDKANIAQLVSGYLETTSFLIVMDDVWSTADWDRLKDAMPKENKKGKVLITSRIDNVGTYACVERAPHKLRLFTQEESWELLRLEALRTRECPPQLETVGNVIAKDCNGLPLAIVIIGGFLAAKFSALDPGAKEREWRNVSEQVHKYLNADEEARMKKFINLSYDILPHHLRLCFLYLGMFPEGSEITASKLILMWIGEGFIQESKDSTLEGTAEEYLADLINRNLVIVEKIKPDGKVKTVRIHDTLRDFCQEEAKNENFLQEIKSNDGVLTGTDIHKCRRLSIHSNCLEFIKKAPDGPRVRSFVCLSKDKLDLPLVDIPVILKAFKLVRVLDVECIKFPKLNSNLFHLIHVRYIALSSNLPSLSLKFCQLWNLQTLIVRTTSNTLDVKADIWKLIRLRHFKTNVPTTLPKPSKDNKYGAQLQTLGIIAVESCTDELFRRACNLKKLSIRGRLSLLLDAKKGSFDSMIKMKNLENLKLRHDVHPDPPSEGQLDGLPRSQQFPSRLKSLTLRATYLDWTNMSILGELANLEVLKLKDMAFTGKVWVATDGGFPRLEVLVIKNTDLEMWVASSPPFPKLRGLVLWNCEKLLGVPAVLANKESFQKLELNTCRSAIPSARKVEKAKMIAQAAFKLSIFPTD